jgi:hypothetical protein
MNIKWPYTKYNNIDNIGFETIFLEKPISNIIDFEWEKILEPPPKNSSQATMDELLLISRTTKNRTQKDIELVYNIDQDIDTPFILLLNQYKLKYPQNYIDLFYDIVHPILLNVKGFWNRPRPNQLAKLYNINIDLIKTDTTHTAAYPSGHTVYSSLVASILKDIYPQIDQKKLENIVLETARARVTQGVHYPSDNKASLIFTKFVFDKLNPKLRKYYND